jgi:hypothetical protein
MLAELLFASRSIFGRVEQADVGVNSENQVASLTEKGWMEDFWGPVQAHGVEFLDCPLEIGVFESRRRHPDKSWARD